MATWAIADAQALFDALLNSTRATVDTPEAGERQCDGTASLIAHGQTGCDVSVLPGELDARSRDFR